MLLIASLLLSAILLIILRYMTIYKNFWRKRNVPQEHGIIWKFMTENKSLSEIYKDIYDAHPKEDNVGIFLGSKPAILIKNLENLQAVLQGDFQSFYSRGIVINSNDLLADNVLFMDDYQRWRIVRQKLSPVFTSKKLKNMFYILERCAQDFVKLIEKSQQAKDKPFIALYTYTTASIAAAVFGIDTHTKNTMDSPFLEMAWQSQEPTFLTNLKFTISNMFPKLYNLLKLKIFGEHEDFFINVVKRVLKARRNEFEKRHDFIDTCIELQNEGLMQDSSTGFTLDPSDELMAAQAFFFFIAGADTSAQTMLFVLLELSGNPNVLQKLHKEIDNVFDQCKEKITFDNIESMKYLNMVMNEAMRKYPTIGSIQRRCTRQTMLPVGQVKMEKDEIAVIPIYALHRDERYFPNPDLFDPERFSPENSSKIMKFSFLPFGEGNRVCLDLFDPERFSPENSSKIMKFSFLPFGEGNRVCLDLFDPERFSPENTSKIMKFSFLPFGEGNRVCLGERFARLQVKVGLAWLLRRYTLKEQVYSPKHFEPSSFSIRDPNAHFDLIARGKF